MFWEIFSFSEVGSLMPIEGMVNLYKCIDVIERKVIPNMWRAFADGGGNFQQDYFACLSSEKGEDGFQETKIECVRLASKLARS